MTTVLWVIQSVADVVRHFVMQPERKHCMRFWDVDNLRGVLKCLINYNNNN